MVSKLFKNFSANIISQIVNTLIQFFSIPLFLKFWGSHLYGEYLLLFSIPSYFIMVDFGLGITTSNQMTMEFEAKKFDSLNATFNASLTLILIIILISITASILLVFHFNILSNLNLTNIQKADVGNIVLLLLLYVLLSMFGNLFEGIYRCCGRYHISMILLSSIRFTEWLGMMASVIVGYELLYSVIILVILRFIGTFVYAFLAKKINPVIKIKLLLHKNNFVLLFDKIRDITKKSFNLSLFPLSNIIVSQGSIFVIFSVLGSQSLILFTTVRTFCRIIFQVGTLVHYSYWPEFSSAYGANNTALVKSLNRSMNQIIILILTPLLLGLFLISPIFFRFWTQGRINPDGLFIFLFLVDTLIYTIWNGISIALTANNSHYKYSSILLLLNVVGLFFLYFLTKIININGAVLSLIIIDMIILLFFLFYGIQRNIELVKLFIPSIFSLTPNILTIKNKLLVIANQKFHSHFKK